MSAKEFIQAGVRELRVARDSDATSLVWRYPSSPIPEHAQLVVEDGESAVFFGQGGMLGLLGPGRHLLTSVPFLSRVKTPSGLAAVVFFVRRGRRLGVRGDVGSLEDTEGQTTPFEMDVFLNLEVDDPIRLAQGVVQIGTTDAIEPAVRELFFRAARAGLGPRVIEGKVDTTVATSVEATLVQLASEEQAGIRGMGIVITKVELAKLATSEGLAAKSFAVEPAPAEPPLPAELPIAFRWGTPDIPFYDTDLELSVPMRIFGHYEGECPETHVEWVKRGIIETLQLRAGSFKGSVLDLAAQIDEWSRVVTQAVVPHLRHHTGCRGRVVVGAMNPTEEGIAEVTKRMGG